MTAPGCDDKRHRPCRSEVHKGKHLGSEGRQEGPVEPHEEHQNGHGDQVHPSTEDPFHGSSQFCSATSIRKVRQRQLGMCI
jgi:hypothetical protein